MSYTFEVRELESVKTLATRGTCAHDQIGPTLGQLYGKVMAVMTERELKMEGPPFSMYTDWRESDCDIEAGCPISGDAPTEGEVSASELPACTAVTTRHVGPYEKLPEAHHAMHAWVSENGKDFAGACWEIYLTDPDLEPDSSKWVTDIYYPIKG